MVPARSLYNHAPGKKTAAEKKKKTPGNPPYSEPAARGVYQLSTLLEPQSRVGGKNYSEFDWFAPAPTCSGINSRGIVWGVVFSVPSFLPITCEERSIFRVSPCFLSFLFLLFLSEIFHSLLFLPFLSVFSIHYFSFFLSLFSSAIRPDFLLERGFYRSSPLALRSAGLSTLLWYLLPLLPYAPLPPFVLLSSFTQTDTPHAR